MNNKLDYQWHYFKSYRLELRDSFVFFNKPYFSSPIDFGVQQKKALDKREKKSNTEA